MQLELDILTIIKFDLNILLPFEPCLQFLSQCSQLDLLSHVWQLLLQSFRSDIYLRYPPYLICLSIIYIVCATKQDKFGCYLEKFKVPLSDITECVKYITQWLVVTSKHDKRQHLTQSDIYSILSKIEKYYCHQY